MDDLIPAFDGNVMHTSGRGLLVGAPTGDEVPLGCPSDEGLVRVRLWHEAYPASRVVVAVG